MRGHMWTALLNPIDRPPTPSIFFRTSLPRPSFHPKPLHYSSHSPLILISMLLLISGDIHPNPGPIDPCAMCPSSSQPIPSLSHSNPVSSFFSVSPSSHTSNPPPPLTNNHKPYLQKLNPPPKQPQITPTNLYLPSLSFDYFFFSNPTYHLSHTILFSSFLSLSKQPPNPTVEC